MPQLKPKPQRANATHTLTTRELSDLCGATTHTIRTMWYRVGNYRGLVPKKQPNGYLLWPRRSMALLAERDATTKRGRKPFYVREN